ncbi:hypothetical protein [Sphingobacterium sp. MYb388]|uniref:hypothetical protein n=1 Tax=Sphingobacterium sp. MYb388 TaxID=2745437 RepID=UPI0030AAAC25
MEIKINANKFLYYKNASFENLEVELKGDLNYNSNDNIQISIDRQNYLLLPDIGSLNDFSERIRGASKDSFINALNKENIKVSAGFYECIRDLNEFSFNSVKSLFLLFNWLHIPLLNQEFDEIDINKTFYDDFVVDWTNRPESQKDIYLIKQDHIVASNDDLLQHLIKINLLCKISIFPYRDNEIISYFTPLSQPGISKELFEFEDNNLNKKSSYYLWRKIIQERDIRIRNWSINRF